MDSLPEEIIHHISTFAPDHRENMAPVLLEIRAWETFQFRGRRFSKELERLDQSAHFSVLFFNRFTATIRHINDIYTVRIGPCFPMEEPRFFLQRRRLEPFDWWSPAFSIEAAIKTYHAEMTSQQPVFYQIC